MNQKRGTDMGSSGPVCLLPFSPKPTITSAQTTNANTNTHTVGQRPQPSFEEVEATNAHLKKQNREAIRMMLPFALLVLIILLLLFKFISGGTGSGADGSRPQVHCSEGAHTIQVEKGQTCWSIAQDYGLGVSDLLELEGNENADCDGLGVGQKVCVPK